MHVMHAIWLPEPRRCLAVWAEESRGGRVRAHSLRVGHGEGVSRGGTRLHPFAAGRERLELLLYALYPIALEYVGKWGTCVVYLPSRGEAPAASPELFDSEGEGSGGEVRPWCVEAFLIRAEHAGDFLRSVPYEAPRGVTYGEAMRYWRVAADWALELVSRQCVVPGVVRLGRAGKRYEGRWQVVLGGADADRLEGLARGMPGICRAWKKPEAFVDAREVVKDFLNYAADGFIRERVYESAQYSWLPERRGKRIDVEEQWLAALTSERAELRGERAILAAFQRAVQEWLAPVMAGELTPYRLCFRLQAPDPTRGDADTWRLEFYLQARDDPRVLVSAEEVWRRRSVRWVYEGREFVRAQEELLGALGRASRVYPVLDEALKEPEPTHVGLDTMGAYEFMHRVAPVLEQSGHGVELPRWWRERGEQLNVRLRLRPMVGLEAAVGRLGTSKILSLDWELAVGGEALSPAEVKRLVATRVPLVVVRGRWVEVAREELERALAMMSRKQDGGGVSLAQVLALVWGERDDEVGLAVSGVSGEGWVEEVLERLESPGAIGEAEAPRGLHGTLRPYQARGVAWLEFLGRLGFGGCLADDMGLGKTVQVIAYVLREREAGRSGGPWLVICPMSVVTNWKREIERFAPSLRVLVHHGGGRFSGEEFIRRVSEHDVVLTTYGLAQRDIQCLEQVLWDGVVLDEAQNIKNPEAKQTQAVRRLRSEMRVALTGTPIENRLSELWSIMEFLNPGYLGSARAFKERFAVPIERYRDTERARILRQLIQPFVLRRVKTDKTVINDLPEKMELTVLCNLTREQAVLYQGIVEEMLVKIDKADGLQRKGLVLATLTKLKQVCDHPALLEGTGGLRGESGKLRRLEEMLEEALAENDKALIYTQYVEMGALLKRRLQERFNREVLFLHGGTSKRQREALVDRFQREDGRALIFILSLKAGGVGLNLTAATRVFHYDRWWNPAVEEQATDRAYRIGQEQRVYVHKFVCAGTVEERIAEMLEQKRDLAERVVGEGEGWITELSTEKLRELFKLREDAVAEE